MGKYARLGEFLGTQEQDHVPMTFREIENLLGHELPASKKYPAWWSNNPSNNPMESVNTASGKVVFRRVRKSGPPPSGQVASNSATGGRSGDTTDRKDRLDALLANMSGLLTLAPGYKPEESLDEVWPEPYLGVEETPHR